MYTVHVIPIARGIGVETLSYFSIRTVAPGSIISVPIRGTQHKALVVSVEEVKNVRQSIRSQSFTLQKIGPDAPSHILFPEAMHALTTIALHHASTTGAAMHGIIASPLIEYTLTDSITRTISPGFTYAAIQQSLSERVVIYKNIIRESLARQESVLFIVPERSDVLRWSERLSGGITKYIVPIHGSLSKKIIKERIARCVEDEHPLVVVATPKFMMIPRHDIGAMVLERESSATYRERERPHLNYAVCAQLLARAYGIRYIVGDSLLSMRVHQDLDAHVAEAHAPLSTHARGPATFVPVIKQKEERSNVFTAATRDIIQTNIDAGKSVTILCARAGYATCVICSDCGTRVTCTSCGHNMRLERRKNKTSEEERQFTCLRCGAIKDTHTTCTTCNSWKLTSYGFGIERIKDACTHYFPGVPIEVVGETNEPKETVLSRATREKGTILIMSAVHMHALAESHVLVIPSLEAQTNIPTSDADESVVRMLTMAREITTGTIIVQTYSETHPLLSVLESGEIASWIRNELSLRHSLHLPPATKIISISITGKKAVVVDAVASLLKQIARYKPKPFPELIRVSEKEVSHTTTLTFPIASWPHEACIEMLRALPPQWDIDASS